MQSNDRSSYKGMDDLGTGHLSFSMPWPRQVSVPIFWVTDVLQKRMHPFLGISLNRVTISTTLLPPLLCEIIPNFYCKQVILVLG